MREYIKKLKGKTVIMMCIGVALIGVGVALLRLSGLGTDPFSCMNIGVSNHLPISYGTYQLFVNIVLFVPMAFFYRMGLGLGTIVNMVGVAYVADFMMWLLHFVNVTEQTVAPVFWMRIFLLMAGICVLCFGVAFYMECNLGIAPYDALGPMIEKYTKGKLKFKWARIITDVICVTIGYFTGAVVGIATVVTAFFTGPLVSFFREKVVGRWI